MNGTSLSTADRHRNLQGDAMSAIAPNRSLEQRMEALARANQIRSRRAVLKRDLKHGLADPRLLILQPPDHLLTMKLFDLLLAVPKYGRTKTNRLLVRCRISPSKTIGGLSERQRAEIVGFL